MDEIEAIAESARVFERTEFDELDEFMRYAGPDEVERVPIMSHWLLA